MKRSDHLTVPIHDRLLVTETITRKPVVPSKLSGAVVISIALGASGMGVGYSLASIRNSPVAFQWGVIIGSIVFATVLVWRIFSMDEQNIFSKTERTYGPDYEVEEDGAEESLVIKGLDDQELIFKTDRLREMQKWIILAVLDEGTERNSLGRNDANEFGVGSREWRELFTEFLRRGWVRERPNQKPLLTANGRLVLERYVRFDVPASVYAEARREGAT